MPLAMESTWQVQEAKNRFSELIEQALKEGPQIVTRHGRPVVRVVSIADDATTPATGRDDGFAAHLLSVTEIARAHGFDGLEMPIRRSRKRPITLGE